MKKFIFWILTTLQVLLLITAYEIQAFSMKRMGMMRYVLYINKELEAQYPISVLQGSAIGFLVLLCTVILLYVKIKKHTYFKSRNFLSLLILAIILTLSFVIFTLTCSKESYRSYYFTSFILAVTALIQHIKIFVYLRTVNNSSRIRF